MAFVFFPLFLGTNQLLFKLFLKLFLKRSLLEKVAESLEFLLFDFLFTTIAEDLLSAQITVNTKYLLTETSLALGQLGLKEREVKLVPVVSHQTDGPRKSTKEALKQLHGPGVKLGLAGEIVVVEASQVGDRGHDEGPGVET